MTDSSRVPAPHPRRDPELRASHADREAVAELLRAAAGDGRIDLEELEERLEKAFAAKTYGDLEPLTADLPDQAAVTAPEAEEPLELRSVVGDINQTGYWVVPRNISVISQMGNIKIDFSQAECRHREVTLDVKSSMGNVTIIVPHGWSVRTHRLHLTVGSVRNKAIDPPHPDVPTLEVTGRAAMGDVKIRYPNRWETRKRRD